MKTLCLDEQEVYPVYVLAQVWGVAWGEDIELPDELADQFLAADEAFWAAQKALIAYLEAVKRDEHAHDRDIAVNRARLERGRRRHYLRARPVDLT